MAERVEGYEGRAQDGVFKNEKGKRASSHHYTQTHTHPLLPGVMQSLREGAAAQCESLGGRACVWVGQRCFVHPFD